MKSCSEECTHDTLPKIGKGFNLDPKKVEKVFGKKGKDIRRLASHGLQFKITEIKKDGSIIIHTTNGNYGHWNIDKTSLLQIRKDF